MLTVKQLLYVKGSEVWSVRSDASVFEALQVMAEKDIGALLVVDGTQAVGIFSERDYARKVILHGKSSKDTRVSEIMTSDIITVCPEQTITDCMTLMTEKHIRHLPVVADGQLIGLVSMGDVVKAIIGEQEFMIGQLKQYIAEYVNP